MPGFSWEKEIRSGNTGWASVHGNNHLGLPGLLGGCRGLPEAAGELPGLRGLPGLPGLLGAVGVTVFRLLPAQLAHSIVALFFFTPMPLSFWSFHVDFEAHWLSPVCGS